MSPLGRWLRLGLGVLCLVAVPQAAAAHGGGSSRLADVESGPYRLFVWTSPEPVRVGRLHLTVAVTGPPDARTGFADPVLDAAVEVRLAPLSGDGTALVVSATHLSAANPLYYEADVELPAAGSWHAAVTASGAEGSGSAGFDFQVLPALVIAWQWALFGALALLLLLGLAGFVYGRSAVDGEMRRGVQGTV